MHSGEKKSDNKCTLSFTNFHIFLSSVIAVRYFTNARNIIQGFQFFLDTCNSVIK